MALHTKIFLGLLIGFVAGLFCNLVLPQDQSVKWIVDNIAFPTGQVFMRLIFMIVIPLVFTAIVLGVAELGDIHKIERIGLKILIFTVVVTAISVVIGVVLVNTFQPGVGISEEERKVLLSNLTGNQAVTGILKNAEESKSIVQTILDIIPKNPLLDASFAFDGNYRGGGMLALMFFAVMVGIAISLVGKQKIENLTNLLESAYKVIMKVIEMAMKLAPLGVAALIFTSVSQMGLTIVLSLLKYVTIVIAGLLIHNFVTYGLIIRLTTKHKIKAFFQGLREVILTAFSTSSSNVTLPTAIKVAREDLKIKPDVANFVLTVGATANQNGTALYEGITVLFLAQFYGIDLSVAQQVTVVFMSILAGVGTAGVPGGSLPLIVIVLQSVGIPPEGIGIILGVDRILDMCRTVVNVNGDITLAAWVDASESKRQASAGSSA